MQKVVRSVPLPVLIEYVRDVFRLPVNLPVPYSIVPDDEDGDANTVTTFACPLADHDSSLAVEVLGVYVGGNDERNDDDAAPTLPKMAMVVIRKTASSSGDSMMGLYEDSERRIVSALERGLDDLAEGRIGGMGTRHPQTEVKTVEEEVKEVLEKEEVKTFLEEYAKEGNTKEKEEEEEEEFAVRQARKFASERNAKREQSVGQETMPTAAAELDYGSNGSLMDSANDYVDDVLSSDDSMFGDESRRNPYRDENGDVVIDVDPTDTEGNTHLSSAATTGPKTTDEMTEEERQQLLNSVFQNPLVDPPPSGSLEDGHAENPFEDLLGPGSAHVPDVEITPEELLQDVMDFGKKNSPEENVGQGFSTGAFEKAKELLRNGVKGEQRTTPAATTKTNVVEKEHANIADFMEIPSPLEEPLDEQEQLRRIFEAGERAAEGRVVQNDSSDSFVDALIDGENTVPRAKRNSEEELAELELRIARGPDDPVSANGGEVFDLFDRPKPSSMYDDIDESDPYGPGNSDQRTQRSLPVDLREAVKNAEFAAETLSKLTQDEETGTYFVGKKEIPHERVAILEKCVEEAVRAGLIDVHPLEQMAERSRLAMLLDELSRQPHDDVDRFEDIVESYRDLLLSDRLVELVKERLVDMADRELARRDAGTIDTEEDARDALERDRLTALVGRAALLLKEVRAVGAELEASQVEIVRSVCQVAMNPKYTTEQEVAEALTDTVRGMRPLLDDNLVAYLKYAVAEEEGRLARRGQLEDPEHNAWLLVLKIVQQGVYAELAVGVSRYIDHVSLVLRMKTRAERKELLRKLVDDMPSMDVRPFVRVIDNIVASLGASARGDFADGADVLGGMTKEILQLATDLDEILPPERIQEMSRDADEWAARQREKLKERRKQSRTELRAKQAHAALVERAEKESDTAISGDGDGGFASDLSV